MQIRQNMTSVCELFLFLLLQEKWQRAVHLSGSFHVPERVRYKIKKQYWMHRLLTIGLKMCEFRCWGCGAADEGCWWLAAPVGGVAGFCCRSSLGGGGSGRDGGWGSGTTKCKVADKMLHNTVKSRYYVHVLCIFHYFMHFCTKPMPKRTSFPDFTLSQILYHCRWSPQKSKILLLQYTVPLSQSNLQLVPSWNVKYIALIKVPPSIFLQ